MKKNIKVIFISIFMMFVNVNAETKDNSSQFIEIEKQVYDKIADSFAECYTFFKIFAIGAKGDPRAQEAEKIADALIEMGLMLFSKHRSAEMAQKDYQAKILMFGKEMQNDVKEDFSNIHILTNKYQNCFDMQKEPVEYAMRMRDEITLKLIYKQN